MKNLQPVFITKTDCVVHILLCDGRLQSELMITERNEQKRQSQMTLPLLLLQDPISTFLPIVFLLGAGQNCTRWVMQPSQIRFVPVMKLARGLARNTTAFATSSGVPIRPMGLRPNTWRYRSGMFCSTKFHAPPLK